MSIPSWPFKDPDEILDYEIDWSARVVNGDAIINSTWDVPAGIVKETDSSGATSTFIWLAGGTLGETYEMTNHIVTSGGRYMDQSVKLRIKVK